MRRTLAVLSALFLVACTGQTLRVAGTVTLAPGFEAPDDSPHRLVIAAFSKSELDAGTPLDELLPISGLYATFLASNGTFAQPIDYEITTQGDAEEAIVYAFWKTASDTGDEKYAPPSVHDRESTPVEVYQGRSGGAATARHVDLTIDRVRIAPLHISSADVPAE